MNKFDKNSPFVDLPTKTKIINSPIQNELETYSPFQDSDKKVIYEQNNLDLQKGYFGNEEEFIQEEYENEQSENTFRRNLETQEELSGDELEEAVNLNRKYMIEYGWQKYAKDILRQIGIANDDWITNSSEENLKTFTKFFADWQEKNGFKTSLKGVFGLNNWTYFQKKIGFHNLSNKYNIDTAKAIKDNKYYENKIWNRYEIYKYLADNKIIRLPLPVNDEYFAWAVADFQKMKQLGVDGSLGMTTFSSMKTGSLTAPTKSPVKSRWHQFIKNTTLCPAEPFLYGKETYEEMVRAIRGTARGRGHFIYILGWMFDINFPLIPNRPDTTMKSLLKEAAEKEVEIRIMIWNNPYYNQEIAKTEATFNGTGNSLVIRDNVTYGSSYVATGLAVLRNRISAIPSPIRYILDKMDIDTWETIKKYSIASNEGSHHEKVIIVKNEEGLIGFCGGIDINPDRIGAYSASGIPRSITGFDEKALPVTFPSLEFKPQLEILHDVHCRVKGYGAHSLLQRFLWRWRHFKESRGSIYPLMNSKLLGEDERPPQPSLPGKGISNVKILHTYNSKNGADYSRSIFSTVKTAIQNAEKSVHFECQYMISVEIAKLLHDKVKEKEREGKKFYVTILTQEDKFAASDIPIIKRMRKAFMSTLYGSLPRTDERIKVFMLDTTAQFPAHHKVHSKLYIIDRELLIIGSANCSRRSMTYDSETAAVIFNDPGYTNDFVASLEKKYDKISHWKDYWPDHDVKDIDQDLIEKVDQHLNNLSIISVITTLITGIGGKIVLTGAVKALASALPELVRPIVDPYDERTKIQQEFTNVDNEKDFKTSNMLAGETGESFVNESLSLADYIFNDESVQHEQQFNSENTDYESDHFQDYYDQQESTFPFQDNFTKEDSVSNYSSGTFPVSFEIHPDYENILLEEIKREDSKASKSCEGRTCWAKSVLNQLLGLNLSLNNTLDEATKRAVADFQIKNNLSQTRIIDAVTERALLEADAIQKQGATASSIVTEAKTKIEDWTSKGVSGIKTKPQHILNSFRDPRKLWAFVLHHMAFKRMARVSRKYSDPESYINTGAHFCIMFDGRIIQLHPLSRMIWHGNCLSPRSVAVEFEGNFPNIKGKWWIDKDSTVQNKDVPTQAQYDSGRFLARYLKAILGTTHIMAHRQSSDSRENDPGPEIWYNVGQWAIDNLAMTDGGPTFKCGTGNPILPEWRTWGNKSSNISNEFNKVIDTEEWEDNMNILSPQNENREDYYPEDEDIYYEMDEFVKDWTNAVRLNRYYADKLGWNQFHDKINDMLLPLSGLQNVSLGEEAFAQAVSAWQQRQGLSADGIIGPNTWKTLKSYLLPGSTGISNSTYSQTSIPKWVTELTPLLNKYRKDIPLDFLLGWIAVESGGNIKSHTSLDERGYFQVHPEESKTLKIADHERLSSDPEFSISSGIQLVNYLSGRTAQNLARLGLSKDSDLFWYIVKLYHWLPLGVQSITEVMRSNDFNPTNWDDYKAFIIAHTSEIKQVMIRLRGKAWDPLRGIENVEKLYKYARQFGPAVAMMNSNEVNNYESVSTAYEDFRENYLDNEDLISNITKAVELNRGYAVKLGWNQFQDQINDLLLAYSSQQNVSLGEEAFAQAVAVWQHQQGLISDGIIGPNTWSKMKVSLNSGALSQPIQTATLPSGSTQPSVQNIFNFNRWYAKNILDTINNGVVGQNFHSKDQLEKIVRGEQVLNVNPQTKIIQILPIMYHIAEQARLENYREIIFGSFIRPPSGDKCAGHCVGRCIDFNYAKGSFETSDSTQMVVRILRYLLSLPQQYKSSIGFGMPLQGSFFGHKSLTKFKSADLSNLIDKGLQELIRQLGYVFPDNNNHLHIQVNWLPGIQSETSDESSETIYLTDEIDIDTGIEKYIPDFENYSLSYRLNKVGDWAYLLGFRVPDDIVAMLKQRNMFVQYAHNESYSNDLNVDFYRLRIYKYPTINGVAMNAERLIKYIRLNINSLVDTSYCDFYPYNALIDTPLWNSDNPRGSVLKLNIKGPDNASVVVSLSKPTGWRFSTIHTPDTGDHPVSGHREFFIANDPATNGTYFVIKGLDMMSTGVAGLGLPFAGEWGFDQADALWKSMREKIIKLINSNGGTAKSDLTYSERVEWRFVYHSYKNLLEQTFGKGAGSAENSSFFDFQIETSGSFKKITALL